MTFYTSSWIDVKNAPITSVINTTDVKEYLERTRKRDITSVVSSNQCNKGHFISVVGRTDTPDIHAHTSSKIAAMTPIMTCNVNVKTS